jgi:predicted DNA-binding transcriptional regulator YafY
MRRAERLLQLIQVLRRHRRPVTAETIAEELEVSVRTVYRDVVALQADRVPIRGEAGIGYVLEDGFDLPPLMFNADEVEAIILGLRWVKQNADDDLAAAAEDVVAKIGAVLPERLRPLLFDSGLMVPPTACIAPDAVDAAEIREAIRTGRKVTLAYRDERGRETARTIWPLALGYFQTVRIVLGWCELREDFRHFRTDRIRAMEVLDQRYPGRRAALLKRWEAQMQASAADISLDSPK